MLGRSWEIALEAQHDRYRRDRLAVVWKTEPRRDRTGRYVEKAPPDFVGVLADGRGVCFDAKDCTRSRWPLSNVKPHQARDLEAVYLAGGVAFVALRMGSVGHFLPWGALRESYQAWRLGEGSASLGPRDIERIGREMDGADWLGVLTWT